MNKRLLFAGFVAALTLCWTTGAVAMDMKKSQKVDANDATSAAVGPPIINKERVRLQRVMEVEGRAFSMAKYERYRTQVGWGITLAVFGLISAGICVIEIIQIKLNDVGSVFSTVDRGETYEESEREKYEQRRAVAVTSSILAAAFVGIGTPMIILGQRGKRRQRLLKRKNEILGDETGLNMNLSFLFDPGSGTTGLSLNATF